MQPGLSRAIPMAVLGFVFGALAVILLRAAQGIEPVWSTGVGLALSAFTTAIFFVWGMGAFDPAMSAHGGEEHEEVAPAAPVAETPSRILFGSLWQIATFLLMVMVVLFGFATIPFGFTLITTADSTASVVQAGMYEVQIGSGTVIVSQLVVLFIFILVMFGSLAAVGAGLAAVMAGAQRGLQESKLEAAGMGVVSGGDVPADAAASRPAFLQFLINWVPAVILFGILYVIFYYVAIGLILPAPDLPGLNILFPSPASQLVVLSAINAAIFALVILRTNGVLQFVGRFARGLARLLRRVPDVLQ